MVVALVFFAISLVIRAGNPTDRTIAFALLLIGYLVISLGAAIGGDLVYLIGTHVNRHDGHHDEPGEAEDREEGPGDRGRVHALGRGAGRLRRRGPPGRGLRGGWGCGSSAGGGRGFSSHGGQDARPRGRA